MRCLPKLPAFALGITKTVLLALAQGIEIHGECPQAPKGEGGAEQLDR